MKMKRIKWLLAAVFALTAVLTLCIVISAEEPSATYISDDNIWRFQLYEDGSASISSGLFDFTAYLGEETKNITVPSKLVYQGETHKVSTVNKFAFNRLDYLECVVLSEGIKEIREHAFFGCDNIKRIVLPESLVYIDDEALPEVEGVEYLAVKGSYAADYISSHSLTLTTVSDLNSVDNGWHISGGKYYYFENGKAVKSTLKTIDGKKYYFGKDGVMYKSRMISVNNNKYYLGKDGAAYKSRLISLDGKKYYLGKDCIAYKSRLASINSNRYYFGSDGVAYKSRLISVNNNKYYIGKDCIAYKSKFASLDGKKYYFGSDCIMRKGWRNIKDADGVYHKYYFGTDGVMRKGWQKIKLSGGSTYTYYFKSNGIMVTGKVSIDGKTQYFTKDGHYVFPDSPLLKKVYITPTGKKYHFNKACGGSSAYAVTLLEAKEKGLTPCSKCAGG